MHIMIYGLRLTINLCVHVKNLGVNVFHSAIDLIESLHLAIDLIESLHLAFDLIEEDGKFSGR